MVVQGHDVVVVGAGVNGLTTAVCLAERGVRVLVRSAEPPGRSTSAVAGAMIGGELFADPEDPELSWSRTTREAFVQLAAEPDTGVRMASGRVASRTGAGIPDDPSGLPDHRPCSQSEHAGYAVACWMSAPLVDMPQYLDYLVRRLRAAGGDVQVQRVDSLADTGRLVVNCAGLGSMELAGDPGMRPVRGQHVVVANPGITDFFYERGPGDVLTSYLPHRTRLVLGGTVGPGEWSLEPDPAHTEEILRRCIEIEPRIEGARVLGVDVGLRPARKLIRVAQETVDGTRVIHNYGHGGVGVSMSWGCARDAEALVLNALRTV
jgi:D-amino-acid oxidase